MGRRTQHAPRGVTILVAAVLVVIGVLGTFVAVLPETVGIWSYVAATVLLLIGVFIREI